MCFCCRTRQNNLAITADAGLLPPYFRIYPEDVQDLGREVDSMATMSSYLYKFFFAFIRYIMHTYTHDIMIFFFCQTWPTTKATAACFFGIDQPQSACGRCKEAGHSMLSLCCQPRPQWNCTVLGFRRAGINSPRPRPTQVPIYGSWRDWQCYSQGPPHLILGSRVLAWWAPAQPKFHLCPRVLTIYETLGQVQALCRPPIPYSNTSWPRLCAIQKKAISKHHFLHRRQVSTTVGQ